MIIESHDDKSEHNSEKTSEERDNRVLLNLHSGLEEPS